MKEKIRPVNPSSDVAAITAINAWYVENSTAVFDIIPLTTEEMMKKITAICEAYPFFVYERDGRVEGFAYAHPWKEKKAYSKTWETTIYLSPTLVANGIGGRLMQTLFEACRAGGCHTLIACITAENEISCRFHERLGFQQASHFKEVGEKFGRRLDVFDYQLILD